MKVLRALTLYCKYASICIRSVMQYKLSFVMMIIGRFIVSFGEFLAIKFLFDGFTELKGYTYADILLCYSVIQMSFVFAELFGNGFQAFSRTVKGGEFDRMLLRPCSPILQIMGTKFEIGRMGPMITAVITLIIAISAGSIPFNGMRVFTLITMIAGGTLLFISLFMLGASFCFYTIEDTSFINILTYGAKGHGKYPIDVYGKGIMRFCTYLVPYTLIQYYPLQFLLGKSDNIGLAFLPFGVIVFFSICYGIWRIGVKNYKSCGS